MDKIEQLLEIECEAVLTTKKAHQAKDNLQQIIDQEKKDIAHDKWTKAKNDVDQKKKCLQEQAEKEALKINNDGKRILLAMEKKFNEQKETWKSEIVKECLK